MPRIEMRALSKLRPHPKNPNKHPASQIKGLGSSFEEFDVTSVLVVDEHDLILAGHGRVEAAQAKNIKDLPCIIVSGWSEAKKLAFMIADNQHGRASYFDADLLRENLVALQSAEKPFSTPWASMRRLLRLRCRSRTPGSPIPTMRRRSATSLACGSVTYGFLAITGCCAGTRRKRNPLPRCSARRSRTCA
jgi:hypothetical protein